MMKKNTFFTLVFFTSPPPPSTPSRARPKTMLSLQARPVISARPTARTAARTATVASAAPKVQRMKGEREREKNKTERATAAEGSKGSEKKKWSECAHARPGPAPWSHCPRPQPGLGLDDCSSALQDRALGQARAHRVRGGKARGLRQGLAPAPLLLPLSSWPSARGNRFCVEAWRPVGRRGCLISAHARPA